MRSRTRGMVFALVVACVAAAEAGTGVGIGATSGTVVSAVIPSATTITATGCLPSVAGRTSFGQVLPGSTTVTTDDCTISWGSSNDTSSLYVSQQDRSGAAMSRVPDGAIDTGWAAAGFHDSDYGYDDAILIEHRVQSNGGVVLLMNGVSGGVTTARVRRLAATGLPDGTFNGGTGVFSGPATTHPATALDLLDDGRIVLGLGARVYLLSATGVLDTSFNGVGYLDLASGAATIDVVKDVQVDGSSIMVVGQDDDAVLDDRFRVLRLSLTGGIDTNYAGVGAFTFAPGEDAYASGAFVAAGGDLVVYGNRKVAGANRGLALRLTPAGVLRSTWATSGVAVVDATAANDDFRDAAENPDGSISFVNTDSGAGLVKLTPTGTFDVGYGVGGYLSIPIGAGAYPMGIASDGVGGVWVTLYYLPVAPPMHAGFTHVGSTGAVDTSFGTAGVVDFGTTDYFLFSSPQLGNDGRMVLGISDYLNPGPASDVRLARLTSSTVDDFAGSWAATGAFGMCLHTVSAGQTADWTLAGSGNCVSGTTANWRAVPAAPSMAAHATTGSVGTSTFRFGLRPGTSQAPGTYAAAIDFTVIAP